MTNLTYQLQQPGHQRLGVFAVIERDGHMLVGRRHYTRKTGKDVTVWATPGGRCDPGECVHDTLTREVYEEIGVDDLEPRAYIGEADGATEGDTIRLFYCQSDQEPTLMEPEKFSAWRWVPIRDYIDGDYGTFNGKAREMLREFFQIPTSSHVI